MSELAPGSVSLEDDNPSLASIAETPPPAETPPEAPPAPPAPEDTDPEGTVVNPGGEKLVPLNVVADLRGKVRETKAASEAKDAEIAALREKAQKYDQVAGEWQAAQPLLTALKQQQQQQQQRPQVNERAAQYAKDFDLYKPDGTPDVDRAQRIMDFHAAQAREQAQALVQPIYQNSAQQQSLYMREQAKQLKAPNGMVVDPKIIDEIWRMVPAELAQRPEIANMLWRQAVADQVLGGQYKAPVTPPQPPLHTESLGGTASAPKELTSVERSMIQAVGMKTKDYEDISSRFKPGERNSLE